MKGIVTETYPDMTPYAFTLLGSADDVEYDFKIYKGKSNFDDLASVVENSRRRKKRIEVSFVKRNGHRWVQTAVYV